MVRIVSCGTAKDVSSYLACSVPGVVLGLFAQCCRRAEFETFIVDLRPANAAKEHWRGLRIAEESSGTSHRIS